MDIEEVRKSLLPAGGGAAAAERDALPARFYDAFVLNGLRLDIIEPGRVVCSMTVPPRLVNSKGYLHGGVIATLVDVVGSAPFYSAGIGTSGVSLEISTSFVDAAFADEEIEIEAKLLNAGKSIGVCSVELRRKKTGKIIARARHTKYIAVSMPKRRVKAFSTKSKIGNNAEGFDFDTKYDTPSTANLATDPKLDNRLAGGSDLGDKAHAGNQAQGAECSGKYHSKDKCLKCAKIGHCAHECWAPKMTQVVGDDRGRDTDDGYFVRKYWAPKFVQLGDDDKVLNTNYE